MKLAIVATVWNEWDSATAFLKEAESAIAKLTDVQASIWLVDDGSNQRPPSWNALAVTRLDTHVLELAGHQGLSRSQATALGFLACELDSGFDAYLMLRDLQDRNLLHSLPMMLQTAQQNSGAIVAVLPYRANPSRLFSGTLFRMSAGRPILSSDALLIPATAAEALCHSSCTASHLGAAATKLQIPIARLLHKSKPRPASSLATSPMADCLSALSVFREPVLARAMIFLSGFLLATAALLGISASLHFAGAWIPPAGLQWALSAALLVGLPAFVLVLVLGITSHSLRELRPWTPALDAHSLIREVTRVRRGPYDLSSPPQAL